MAFVAFWTNRRFIGIDIDKETIETTGAKIATIGTKPHSRRC